MVAPTGGEKDMDAPQLLTILESVGKESTHLEKVYFFSLLDFSFFLVSF